MLRVQNLAGFGTPRGAVGIIDDGGQAVDSGAGTGTHTFNSVTSTGPHTYVIASMDDSFEVSLDSYTFDGNSMTKLVDRAGPSVGGVRSRVAILYIAGAQSGDVVLGWSGGADNSYISVVSCNNVNDPTGGDTDTGQTTSGSAMTLNALSSPGAGGVRLVGLVNEGGTASVSWTNATEIRDVDAGTHRHAVAYDEGDDSGNITGSFSSTDGCMVGVAIR